VFEVRAVPGYFVIIIMGSWWNICHPEGGVICVGGLLLYFLKDFVCLKKLLIAFEEFS